MRITQQPAYVLHARAWRETSLLVDAFTHDHGKVALVARGVRAARARLPRALLEPFRPLRLDWGGRGEMATLAAAEPDGAAANLRGDALLSGLYVNELVVRLTARNDPHPRLFQRYAALLDELELADSPGWALRCFERDLLAAIGYAPQLEFEADTGAPIDPAAAYDYLPEQGALPAGAQPAGVRVRGSALLALARGEPPDAADQASLRRLARTLLAVHLGERGLQSWRVLAGPLRPR